MAVVLHSPQDPLVARSGRAEDGKNQAQGLATIDMSWRRHKGLGEAGIGLEKHSLLAAVLYAVVVEALQPEKKLNSQAMKVMTLGAGTQGRQWPQRRVQGPAGYCCSDESGTFCFCPPYGRPQLRVGPPPAGLPARKSVCRAC